MSNKASHTGETARADKKLADKGQTDRFHTLTEGWTSRKAAGSRDLQMDAGEELPREGGKFDFSTENVTFSNAILNYFPKQKDTVEIYNILYAFIIPSMSINIIHNIK